MDPVSEGQLNPEERQILSNAILKGAKKPQVVVEVGTWLGGGSTVTFLRALHQNGTGHLWGVEAVLDIYDRMIANLKRLAPEALDQFTPLFGFSDQVLPEWIEGQPKPLEIDVVFLDGGNRPQEQITEFRILDPYMPVGSVLFAHDAKLRKGKWLVPFLSDLDNWQVELHDVSLHGLLSARKIALHPSSGSLQVATAHLQRLRWAPMEILARITPSGVKRFIFSRLPAKVAARIGGGM